MVDAANLAVVLLAAGPSTRLGRPKQLVQCAGETLVRRSARLLLSLEPQSLTVVSGYDFERIEAEVQDLPLRIARNPDWQDGMGGSIACGVADIPLQPRGVLIMVCDQWKLEIGDLSALVSAWNTDISQIYVASWKEGKAFVSGPPVVFPGRLVRELKFVDRKRGARQVIDRHIEEVQFVELQNAAFDLDRPEDLEKLDQR